MRLGLVVRGCGDQFQIERSGRRKALRGNRRAVAGLILNEGGDRAVDARRVHRHAEAETVLRRRRGFGVAVQRHEHRIAGRQRRAENAGDGDRRQVALIAEADGVAAIDGQALHRLARRGIIDRQVVGRRWRADCARRWVRRDGCEDMVALGEVVFLDVIIQIVRSDRVGADRGRSVENRHGIAGRRCKSRDLDARLVSYIRLSAAVHRRRRRRDIDGMRR